MTGQELIDNVRTELLEPSAGFWSDAELLDLINRGEKDFANRVRGFEGTAIASTEAGENDLPLPANWVSAVAVFYNDVQNNIDNWKPLEPTDLQRVSREKPNWLSSETEARGVPKQYMIWDRTIYLIPTPDVTGESNIKMFFKSKPVPLASASASLNVDDSLAEAIQAFVLWKAWSKEKEFQLAEDQKQLYFEGVRQGLRWVKLQALNKIHNVDVQSSIPYTFGGSSGSFDPLERL